MKLCYELNLFSRALLDTEKGLELKFTPVESARINLKIFGTIVLSTSSSSIVCQLIIQLFTFVPITFFFQLLLIILCSSAQK